MFIQFNIAHRLRTSNHDTNVAYSTPLDLMLIPIKASFDSILCDALHRRVQREYCQIGRWSPERGVELTRAPEEPAGASPPPAAPSYTLEPWSQARRLRMIQEAQRNAAAAAE